MAKGAKKAAKRARGMAKQEERPKERYVVVVTVDGVQSQAYLGKGLPKDAALKLSRGLLHPSKLVEVPNG